MPRKASAAEPEPKPLTTDVCFEEGDFHALSERMAGDVDANARRLLARRKLLTMGKAAAKAIEAGGGPKLECRTSLHHPHVFNGMRVRRIWSYLVRSKADKRKLKSILGAELGKDLDSAYRNAYLCFAIEAEALEVSLRIHSDAWYDGQNLKNRVTRGGWRDWLALLNTLDGFHLRLDDWKGEWKCGALTIERLEEFMEYYTPGEHRLTVERRWPAPAGARGAALTEDAPRAMIDELSRLVPLLRFSTWSPEENHLFGG